MKKTPYEMCICITNSGSVWRRVWEKDGRYFVKYNGETRDVTKYSNTFCKF